ATSASTPSSGGRKADECWCGWKTLISTLLSPEGTTRVVGLRRTKRQAWPCTAYRQTEFGLVLCVVVVGWLFVENCTVDASIFVFCRSSCQGRTVDALAPGADEGRGRR